MAEPFLFSFKKKCQSPNRNFVDTFYAYDPDTDMVIDRKTDACIPAIDSNKKHGPVTKKCDVERGEDLKDRRMW